MQIVRNAVVDWEPLTLTLIGTGLGADAIEGFTRQWLAGRQVAGMCDCTEKSLSVGPDETGERIVVDCEWMCERCLADFLRGLELRFPHISQVRIGLEEPPAAERSDESAFVDVAEKHVEMEDGRRVLVPTFRIARTAVTTTEFMQFVESTGYRTTAQEHGLAEVFFDHPAMSPFKRERATSPVACVSFYDATEFCHWKGGVRLPTEYEWLAASIVDERIYDEWADRELLYDAEGRMRQGSLPNALPLDCEWTSTEGDNDMAVVRFGPQWVRFSDWRDVKRNRRLTPKDESSLMVGFRVVLST